MTATLFHSTNDSLAEGPLWHDEKLWWVDVEAGRLKNSEGQQFEASHSIGSALPCRSGRWLLADEHGFSFWNLKDAPVSFWTRPERSPAYRFNDAKVAPDGSVWAGSFKRETLEGNCTYYRLGTDGVVTPEIPNIGLCNGMDWFDGSFYYTDTGAQTIYQRKSGLHTVFKKLKGGYPDGLTVDAEGQLWVAIWGEGKVLCLDRNSTAVIAEIEVPVPNVSSCCFGGDNFSTLYITTARQGLTADQLKQYPESGSIFSCHSGSTGRATPIFNDGALV